MATELAKMSCKAAYKKAFFHNPPKIQKAKMYYELTEFP